MDSMNMPPKRTTNYIGEELRKILYRELKLVFGADNVETKWRATDGSTDDFDGSYIYTPETDLVIKPFNITRNIEDDNRLINDVLQKYKDFLNELNSIAVVPFQRHLLNRNPRCFLAIEVGGSGSEKHLLGDMYNASVLGKIGFVVSAVPEVTISYKRLYEYANFAYTVGKTNQSFGNLAILEGNSFLAFIKRFSQVS